MSEIAARCSLKKLSSKFQKILQETPLAESISNNGVSLQADYSWIFRISLELLLYRTSPEDSLFHLQVEKFQAAFIIKSSFTGSFQAFCTRTKSNYWNVLV